ncbi:hypothetical protein X777_09371 [Ooceraea biroi]|uniref:Uncharacterized protein n=3 Tax=Ooceraea biroi TaxID=2015173 RepID=A0A026X0C8_OOCBI|nr:hypothetical protein X777_09371 [Ooceraea biroi]
MVMRDFRDNDRQLIMLRPNSDVLKSVQSLSSKPILTARSDTDLLAVLREVEGTARSDARDANNDVEIPNCKIACENSMDELTTTKL